MVSMLSVILHMVVAYHKHIAADTLVPYAQAKANGGQACLEVLRESGSFLVEDRANDKLTLRELIMGYSVNFSKISLHTPGDRNIYGYEFFGYCPQFTDE
jgi:hypothetical protein